MFLSLTVDTGRSTADEVAHITGLLSQALHAALKHGHVGNLSVADPADDDPTEVFTTPEDDAYRRGYDEGFRTACDKVATLVRTGTTDHDQLSEVADEAYQRGRAEGRAAERLTAATARRSPEVPPAGYTVPRDYSDGYTVGDVEKMRDVIAETYRTQARTGLLGAKKGPVSPLCDSDTHRLCGEGGTGCGCDCHEPVTAVFPPTLPAPDDTLPPPWLYTQVAAALSTPASGVDAVIENYARMGEQGSERTTVLPITTSTNRPDGDRPAPGPGAPVSAYDSLALSVGWSYGFPQAPENHDCHTDTEGAEWAYDESRRTWDRLCYPREWAPASPVNFTAVHVTTDTSL